MNHHLTESIVEHVFANFVIFSSDFVNLDRTQSLTSHEYLLSEKLNFEIDEKIFSHKIWGCQMQMGAIEFRVLLGDCSNPEDVEYAMIVQGKDMPTWGCYFSYDVTNFLEREAMIACLVPNKDNKKEEFWMESTIFLQASFLAGMEQLKDSGLPWGKCSNYKEEYQRLLTFIKYHNTVRQAKEDFNEGQEKRF